MAAVEQTEEEIAMKKIATIIFAGIIGLSMTLAPTFMSGDAYADDQEKAQTEEPVSEDVQDEQTDAETPKEDAKTPEKDADSEDADSDNADSDNAVKTMGESEEASDDGPSAAEGSALEGLAGKNISEVENDPEISWALEDPTFYRYYDVDEDGMISDKKVDLDEIEEFIAKADANADGIDDTGNIETDGDITAMGGGVTGLGKAQTPSKYRNYKRYHCIDISWWQGKVSDANWKKIKAAGVTHAIIRCGYSTLRGGDHNTDSTFANNLNGAYKAGIKVGVYYYSTAVSVAEAKSEAKYTISVINNYKSKITLPVVFDYETGGRLTSKVMKSVGTASCIGFCDTIKAAGYTPMVYANYNTLCNFIDYKTLQKKYKMWLANYTNNGVATTYPGSYWMWQYSSSGKVNGLSGNIDINYIFEPKTTSSEPAKATEPAKTTAPAATTSSSSSSTKPATTSKAAATKAKAPDGNKAVTTCKMNYRKGPSKKKKKVGSYKKGTTIYIKSFHGNWAKMTNGYYINRSHLKYKAIVLTEKVNYRTGPGTKYKKKGSYKAGKIVTIVKVKNGWAKMDNGRWLKVKHTKIQ